MRKLNRQWKTRDKATAVAGRAAGLAGLVCLALGSGSVVFAQETTAGDEPALYIAGLAPDHRPEQAPVITEMVKPPGWYAAALHGVSQPYPNSLKFLEDQGAWWTPFIHPGMTGPYDIRGWHAAD